MENPPLESSENRPRLFFGWWIVLAGSILAGVGAVGHTCVAERLSEIIQELGDSPASMAAILGVSHGASAIAMLVTGPLIDRWGPGKPMLVGIALAGLGMIGLSIPALLWYSTPSTS